MRRPYRANDPSSVEVRDWPQFRRDGHAISECNVIQATLVQMTVAHDVPSALTEPPVSELTPDKTFLKNRHSYQQDQQRYSNFGIHA